MPDRTQSPAALFRMQSPNHTNAPLAMQGGMLHMQGSTVQGGMLQGGTMQGSMMQGGTMQGGMLQGGMCPTQVPVVQIPPRPAEVLRGLEYHLVN